MNIKNYEIEYNNIKRKDIELLKSLTIVYDKKTYIRYMEYLIHKKTYSLTLNIDMKKRFKNMEMSMLRTLQSDSIENKCVVRPYLYFNQIIKNDNNKANNVFFKIKNPLIESIDTVIIDSQTDCLDWLYVSINDKVFLDKRITISEICNAAYDLVYFFLKENDIVIHV